jgi:hypothetical protein
MTSERGRFYCQSRDFPPPMEQQCRVLERPVGLGQRGDAPALWRRRSSSLDAAASGGRPNWGQAIR